MALAEPDTATFPDLDDLQRELASLMSGLGRTHEKIAQAAADADKRTAELQEKIIELESLNLASALTIQDMDAEIMELRKQLEERPSLEEWDKLVEERDRALRAYEEVDKTGQVLVAALSKYETQSKRCTCAAFASPSSSAARGGSAMGGTAGRQRPIGTEPDNGLATHPHPSRVATPTPGLLRRQNGSGSAASGSWQSLGSNVGLSTQSSWDSPSSASRAIAKAKQAWYLEFTKPPNTATMGRGPIPFDYLADQLMLNDDTRVAVAKLESTPGYETRIHAESDFAFIYQPFILEGPGLEATYFIEWSTPDRAEQLATWTETLGDLHLFLWPYERAGWYYIGLHSLVYAEMESRWPMLERNEKMRLLDLLRSRNPGMVPVQFRNEIRQGKKVQACLRLESKGLMESQDFAKEYGLLSEPEE